MISAAFAATLACTPALACVTSDGGRPGTDRVICNGFALLEQVTASGSSADFQKLTADLRAAMAFLAQAD
ncbi:hypothetical protein [Gymnodinialimonas ulvae]|uniref:hypothetical protein n=1 Tax=Gymnodinialimonas ulvae TaxID=3126504 RepID=UPI003095FE92